jgi:type VI secretion system secreted protein VgrG
LNKETFELEALLQYEDGFKADAGASINEKMSYREFISYSYHPSSLESLAYNDRPYKVEVEGRISEILTILSLSGKECFSNSFIYRMVVRVSKPWSELSQYIGEDMTLMVSVDDDSRYINCVITNIVQLGAESDFKARKESKDQFFQTFYAITLEPKLATLKKSISCKVHAEKEIMDVVADILDKHKIEYELNKLNKLKIPKIKNQARLQYNTSDYEYIHRLLGVAGVFYCFEHTSNSHIMVFYNGLEKFTDSGKKKYNPQPIKKNPLCKFNRIQRLVPYNVKMYGYHFENAKSIVTTDITVEAKSTINQNSGTCHYEDSMLGDKNQLNAQAENVAAEFSSQSIINKITSYSPSLFPGVKFTLTQSNDEKDIENEYFISETIINLDKDMLSRGYNFSSVLRVHKNGEYYTPPLMRFSKEMPCTLAAKVVGPYKEKLHCDEYGRVQIRFLWQPEEKENFDGSMYCWARVSQFLTGKGMGAQFLPRVGTEVVVSFLGGNPDVPVVIGCLNNGDYLPLFKPNDSLQQTCSGIVTKNPSSDSNKSGNKLCFQDAPEEEYVLLHSQRDLNLTADNDLNSNIKKSMSVRIEEGNYLLTTDKGKVNIESYDNLEIKSDTGITIVVGESKVSISSTKIEIVSTEISFKAKEKLTLSATESVKITSGSIKIN